MGNAPGLVFVSPGSPPVAPQRPAGRYGFTMWIEPDDPALPTWPLTNAEAAGIIMLQGVRGLGKPESEPFAEEYASIDGEYYFGERTKAREVFLPLYLFHDGTSEEWVARDELFWRMFRRGRYSTLFIQHPNGAIRSLRVRYVSGGEESFDRDPAFFGWVTYGIYLRASQPFWAGQTITKSWAQQEAKPLFGASPHMGLPLNVSYRTLDSATLSNPGDMYSWPKATLDGPMDAGAEITIDGKTIDVPFAIPDGDQLIIDYSPTEQSAIMNGVTDRTKDLGSYDFRPVPDGAEVPLGISIPGTTGRLTVDLTPLYERAW